MTTGSACVSLCGAGTTVTKWTSWSGRATSAEWEVRGRRLDWAGAGRVRRASSGWAEGVTAGEGGEPDMVLELLSEEADVCAERVAVIAEMGWS